MAYIQNSTQPVANQGGSPTTALGSRWDSYIAQRKAKQPDPIAQSGIIGGGPNYDPVAASGIIGGGPNWDAQQAAQSAPTYDPNTGPVFTRNPRTPGRDYGTKQYHNYASWDEATAAQPNYRSRGLRVDAYSPLAGALAESLRKNQMIEDQYGSVPEWEAMGRPSFTGGTSALDVLNGVGTPVVPVNSTTNGTSAYNVLNNAMSGVQPATNRFWENWGR